MKDKILQLIRERKGAVSGEEISRGLNMSRAAVWKHIQELRKEGYLIRATPHVGYHLESSPDKLIPLEIKDHLNTKRFGKSIIYLEAVDSTMDIAFKLGVEGAVEGTLVCTEYQKKGKGRMGRKWVSPKGKGLYFSLILRPQMHPAEVSKLTLMSAVAVCEVLKELSLVEVSIKWPNDLLVKNKKIGGILTELSAEMDQVRFIVLGIGINVNTPLKQLPDVGTSLYAETKQIYQRIEVMQAILRKLEFWYDKVIQEGFDTMFERWKELSSTLSKKVKFVELNKEMHGKAIDLAENGALIIEDNRGVLHRKLSGDVEISK